MLSLEVVLSTLITSFKFEPAQTPACWKFAGVAFPSTSKDSRTREMYPQVLSA
ncbi:hypothetical protein C8Q74DRAFT_1260436 [Fomes fomentarius]|nr:hypothetical protein C8Q74DRAFT_1260436 [Fomes fomentarius]